MSGIDKDKIKIQIAGDLKQNNSQPVEPQQQESQQFVSASILKEEEPKKKEEQLPIIQQNTEFSSSNSSFVAPQQQPQADYIKHLITCRCFLPQFKNQNNPPSHKFVVFSELDSNAMVKVSYAACNNCGTVHRITEIGISEVIGKEESKFLEAIDDIKPELPGWLCKLLERYECELHVYQEARFIVQNNLWGRPIVLAKERTNDMSMGKICQILGKELYKIENFERKEVIEAY